VGVAGKLQIDLVPHRLRKRVGVVRNEERQLTRPTALQRCFKVRRTLAQVIDPRDPKARIAVLHANASIHQNLDTIVLEKTRPKLHLFGVEVLVIPADRKNPEGWIQPLEGRPQEEDLLAVGIDEIAPQDHQIRV
jgi:rhodanese-related sulfurtransferase